MSKKFRKKKRGFSFFGEESAQAEAVFRLMIDSVIGLAILLIIISALNFFNSQNIEQSKKDFFTLINNSVNSPDGTTLRSKELFFKKGFAVDETDLEFHTGVSKHCFSFQNNGSNLVVVTPDDKQATVNQDIKLFVYSKCWMNQGCDPYTQPNNSGECCVECRVSFAQPIFGDMVD